VNYVGLEGVDEMWNVITYIIALVNVQVCIHISLVGTPDRASHAGPCLLERKHAFDIISVNLVSRNWVDDRRFDTEKWEGSTSWLGRCNACQRGNDV
jgi:hypothetical protein